MSFQNNILGFQPFVDLYNYITCHCLNKLNNFIKECEIYNSIHNKQLGSEQIEAQPEIGLFEKHLILMIR